MTRRGAHALGVGSTEQNYLIVSDLHVGELGYNGNLERIREVDRALIHFIDWHAAHRIEGRPWQLIIAGDGIDFLRFGLQGLDGDHEEDTEAHAITALEAIVTENRAVFAALARFVGAGHELVLLKGNHDAELHWDGVQRRLRQLLVDLYVDTLPGTADPVFMRAFERKIGVYRWFYYHPGLLYVEHGNQYDELCSFENVLSPVGPDDRIEAPLSHVTLRRFRALADRLDAHDFDRWGLRDFARWVLRLDFRAVMQSSVLYAFSPSWLMTLERERRHVVSRASDTAHHGRLQEVLQRFGLSEEILGDIDALKRTLGGRHLVSGLRMLFWDQIALFATAFILLIACSLVPLATELRIAVSGAVLLGSWFLSGYWFRTRQFDPHPKLIEGARSVAAKLSVPYVVFGHSHVPDVRSLEDSGATYVNTGSWTHEGMEGLTYFRLALGAGGCDAELLRWSR